ncbi:helix-turn-helix domain-containing protein [Nonomuraea sp. B19D2]|uniref:helix-turn-helix domain-containing protein n=1 Tax=Nonomuraea sp. B19D2 TaxID=3159561 RepID=UPI0032DB912E
MDRPELPLPQLHAFVVLADELHFGHAAERQFQRDMIGESTREGVAAAQAAGKTLGRPAALDQDKAAAVVQAYGQGTAVKVLARQHRVAPKTIRRVLDAAGARDLPDQLAIAPDDTGEPALDPDVVLNVPGLLVDHLRTIGDEAVRQALTSGQIIRRGRGYSGCR